eukprot:c4095_g1_i2.p1 GENE.c4095_g1_i2~~c4095_g1_i2.p1  ORF type:complete len:377 (+),score=76.94 c4095_g1_i2:52-1182(+)
MSDVKDILGLKGAPPPSPITIPSSKPTTPSQKPKKLEGVKREVYMLMGKSAQTPIVPSTPIEGLKQKRKVPAAKWRWRSFANPARDDDLQLSHWEKEGTRDPGGYHFAKFNKSIKMVTYTDEEYDTCCRDPAWTKEETDYLFEICKQYDLRFVVIADKYEYPGPARSIEDIKDRYYSVARIVTRSRSGNTKTLADHPLFKFSYNKDYDVERRIFVDQQFRRSKDEEEDDNRRLMEKDDAVVQRRAHRGEREQALVMAALQGEVTDVPGVLHTLMECVTQGKASTPTKKRGKVALDLLGETNVPESLSGNVRRYTTLSRQKALNAVFEGSKAKKIETIGQEFGFSMQQSHSSVCFCLIQVSQTSGRQRSPQKPFKSN